MDFLIGTVFTIGAGVVIYYLVRFLIFLYYSRFL